MEFCVKKFDELTTSELYEILMARQDIFTIEKGMHCRDVDGLDKEAMHCILRGEGLLGYLRITQTDGNALRLGRVITKTHGLGHGKILLEKTVAALRKSFPKERITVHAQHDAVGFYEKCGFEITSVGFYEEGVLHYAMELREQG